MNIMLLINILWMVNRLNNKTCFWINMQMCIYVQQCLLVQQGDALFLQLYCFLMSMQGQKHKQETVEWKVKFEWNGNVK